MELKPEMLVVAKKPGGRRPRQAKVYEAAKKGQHGHVKVKFPGDLVVYSLPWKDIDCRHLVPAPTTPPLVSANASSADVEDLTTEINSEGDRTSSKEPGPFVRNGEYGGGKKEPHPKDNITAQRRAWLSGVPVMKEPSASKELQPPGVTSVRQGGVGADSTVLHPVVSNASSSVENIDTGMRSMKTSHRPSGSTFARHDGPYGARSSSQHPGSAYRSTNGTALQPFQALDIPQIIPMPTQNLAPQQQQQQNRMIPLPRRVSTDLFPPPATTSNAPNGSVHSWPSGSQRLYPSQATVLPNSAIVTSDPERNKSMPLPPQKRKEGHFEFKTHVSVPSSINNSPVGACDFGHHERSRSEFDAHNFSFSSPPKRPRTANAAIEGADPQYANVEGQGEPKLVPRHPVRGLDPNIAIPHLCGQTGGIGYRIPRKRDRRDPAREPHPPPYGNSRNSTTRIAKPPIARRRLQVDVDSHLTTEHLIEGFGQNEALTAQENQERSILRVDSDLFRHKVIAKKKRPPAAPVATSFRGTKRFPFKRNETGGTSETDAEVWKICDSVSADVREEQRVDEVSRDLEAMAVSQRSPDLGRRRKSMPKRWRRSSNPQVTAVSVDKANAISTFLEESASAEDSDPRIFDCDCGSGLSQRRALQCGMCGLWSHLSCVQAHEVVQSREGDESRRRRFMCTKCTERILTEKGILASVYDDESAPSCPREDPVSFFFAQIPISNISEKVAVTDSSGDLSHSAKRAGRRKATIMVRPPLTVDDITARAENVELLRSGVCGPSAGKREQEVIDSHIRLPGPP